MVITIEGLTKRYGSTLAVDDLSTRIRPGAVTGLLGPNGAGKSSTLRMLLGLDRPTAGTALIAGLPYRRLTDPLRRVGALLDASDIPAGPTGVQYLTALARSNGIGRRRVDEVLDRVGLAPAARRRVRGYSLGMRQRLGIAAALLGDPPVLVLDEPVNGLDPEGIRWLRLLLRQLAAEGRTVLLSSHLMSEMEHTADRLVVLASGRLLADTTMDEFLRTAAGGAIAVRTPAPRELAAAVEAAGGGARLLPDGTVEVTGLTPAELGELTLAHRIPVHASAPAAVGLEHAFMTLTTGVRPAGKDSR